jgi:hypothetical protein
LEGIVKSSEEDVTLLCGVTELTEKLREELGED